MGLKESKLYVRITEGLNDIGKLVEKDAVSSLLKKDKDYYSSIYYYNESQKKKASEIVDLNGKKRPRGIAGITDVFTDKLVWDLDSEKVIDAKRDAITLVIRLKNYGIEEDAIRICFSGKKGFAVEVHTDQQFTPDQFKAVTQKFAQNLKTFDSVVANPSRVFRIPLTKHQDSGLYKTPLTYTELKDGSVEQIKELAKAKPEKDDEVVSSWTKTETKFDIPEVEVKQEAPKTSETNPYFRVDYAKNPFKLIPWKLAISQGIFPAGTRNDSLMILGATLKAKGMDREQCYYALKASADKQAKIFSQDKYSKDEIWKNIITPIYSALWSGATYSTSNFPQKLRDFFLESGIPEINEESIGSGLVGIDELFGKFSDFAQNIEKNTIKTGIKELDGFCRILTGMLVGWLGCPGSGKTASMLEILQNLSSAGEEAVFFSLDMSGNQIYEKLAKRCTDYSEDEIFRAFQNNQQHVKEDIRNQIKDSYSNIQFNFQSSATVDDMKKYVRDYEESSGKKVRLVVVDYLEKIKGSHSDPTVAAGQEASKLQDMAKELDVAVIVLLQPQKMVGEPDAPITSYRKIKGASRIEQDCRIVVSQWRPGYDPQTFQDDRFITYAVLKNTMGSLGVVDCFWNGERGKVRGIDDQGRRDLKDLVKQKETLKKLNDGTL